MNKLVPWVWRYSSALEV